uniref:HECT domain-containing protein n=1 Tax=Myripristis murdjan TaxID=586833 RepID=A0A667WFJ7_9TELE
MFITIACHKIVPISLIFYKQTGLSLADILMFATGLSSLPPSGINPRPKLVFQRVSRFPCCRTCANTMEIPLSMTYEEFQKDMDFGIQNSPVLLQFSHVLQCDIKFHTGLPGHWLH